MPLPSLAEARAQIVEVGRWMDRHGWAPAGAGNYSLRLARNTVAVTVSGAHKGRLTEAEVMTVDADGRALDGKRPSAETALHLQLYRLFPEVNAVLHGHSPGAVALSRVLGDGWTIEGHELLKIFPGIDTHEAALTIPIVENSQDMRAIEQAIAPRLLADPPPPGYLIRGHGFYGWGRTMDEAMRVIEGGEWLVQAEIVERALRGERVDHESARGVRRD